MTLLLASETKPTLSDQPTKSDISAFEPAVAEIERRAIELAKADGIVWAAPGTPEQGGQGQPGAATNEDREKYRKLPRDRLEAVRGLIVD